MSQNGSSRPATAAQSDAQSFPGSHIVTTKQFVTAIEDGMREDLGGIPPQLRITIDPRKSIAGGGLRVFRDKLISKNASQLNQRISAPISMASTVLLHH